MTDVVTLEDIKQQKRRSWLKYLAVGLAGVGGGWWLFADSQPDTTELSILIDSNIDDITWNENMLIITLSPDVDGDEWVVMHEYHDDPSEAIRSGTVPEFGGDVRVDMESVISSSEYPTDRFEFVLYSIGTGEDFISMNVERESGIEFELPN